MVINRVGPPVRGDDLFGRDAFVELLWKKLRAGNVLLASPRQFGKTSVMYRLIDKPQDDFKIIHADLEHFARTVSARHEFACKLLRDWWLRHYALEATS